MGNRKKISTYVINLKKTSDRRIHIQNQFNGHTEFNLNIVEAHENPVGAIGLWNTIYTSKISRYQ